jgi:hypothetical protein
VFGINGPNKAFIATNGDVDSANVGWLVETEFDLNYSLGWMLFGCTTQVVATARGYPAIYDTETECTSEGATNGNSGIITHFHEYREWVAATMMICFGGWNAPAGGDHQTMRGIMTAAGHFDNAEGMGNIRNQLTENGGNDVDGVQCLSWPAARGSCVEERQESILYRSNVVDNPVAAGYQNVINDAATVGVAAPRQITMMDNHYDVNTGYDPIYVDLQGMQYNTNKMLYTEGTIDQTDTSQSFTVETWIRPDQAVLSGTLFGMGPDLLMD